MGDLHSEREKSKYQERQLDLEPSGLRSTVQFTRESTADGDEEPREEQTSHKEGNS
jgi:hypothetical protein